MFPKSWIIKVQCSNAQTISDYIMLYPIENILPYKQVFPYICWGRFCWGLQRVVLLRPLSWAAVSLPMVGMPKLKRPVCYAQKGWRPEKCSSLHLPLLGCCLGILATGPQRYLFGQPWDLLTNAWGRYKFFVTGNKFWMQTWFSNIYFWLVE